MLSLWGEMLPPLLDVRGGRLPHNRQQHTASSFHLFTLCLQAIQSEADCEVLAMLLEPLHQCIEIVGTNINAEQWELITTLIKNQLIDNEHRQQSRAADEQDQDWDEEEAERMEQQLEQEDEVLCT